MASVREVGFRQASANESPWIQRDYYAEGYSSETDTMQAVLAHLQSTIGNPPDINANTLKNIYIREMSPDNAWRVQVTWGVFQRPYYRAGESQFNFEIGVQPTKVIVPVEPQSVYKRSDDQRPLPADSDRWLIGDQGLGDGPEGVEIFEPAISFSETHYVDASILTQNYRTALMRTVAKTNDSQFKGWNPGEVLCIGITGSARGVDDWEISFRFAARENQTNLTVAGIPVASKEGWEYLWPRYQLKHDEDAVVTANVIQYIVVAKVFQDADFSVLGIGT